MIERTFYWMSGEKVQYEEFGSLCVFFFILHAIEYNPSLVTSRIKKPIVAIVITSILFLFVIMSTFAPYSKTYMIEEKPEEEERENKLVYEFVTCGDLSTFDE